MDITPYFGAYQFVQDVTMEESKFLSSSESVIGSPVTLVFNTDEDGRASVGIESSRGYPLGHFSPEFSTRLSQLKQEGLICKAYLSTVVFAESSGMFWGEFAVICYAPGNDTAWEHYCVNLRARIANGDHPDMHLGEKNRERVIESNGEWCLNKSVPYDKLERGVVYYKKRRSWSDALVEMAVGGNIGCKVGSWVCFIVLVLALVFFVWRWFFS